MTELNTTKVVILIGVELLALYSYPAQVLFCNRPLQGLADVAGLRVRVSSVTQADFLEPLGAQPVVTRFNDIVPQMRRGNVDCAVTGSLSGYAIGLHQLSSHLHPMPLTWGLAIFVANATAWQALPPDLRILLQRELTRLERAVWAESERETADGIACATGAPACSLGAPARPTGEHRSAQHERAPVTLVQPNLADQPLRRRVLAETVIPRWRQRCGPHCDSLWPSPLQPLLDSGFGR